MVSSLWATSPVVGEQFHHLRLRSGARAPGGGIGSLGFWIQKFQQEVVLKIKILFSLTVTGQKADSSRFGRVSD